jgi:hypothetical protein
MRLDISSVSRAFLHGLPFSASRHGHVPAQNVNLATSFSAAAACRTRQGNRLN